MVEPILEPVEGRLRLMAGDEVLADSDAAHTVTQGGPPVYYFPPEGVRTEWLVQNSHDHHCPYKGDNHGYDLKAPHMEVHRLAWSYYDTKPGFEAIQGHFAFFPEKVGGLTLDDTPL